MSETPQEHMTQPSDNLKAPATKTLYLVRHGETFFNVERKLPSQLEGVILTDRGKDQSQQLGIAMLHMPIDTIVTSTLERAVETAKLVRGSRDIPLYEDARLMDVNVGRWGGRTIPELAKEDPDWNAYVRSPFNPPEGIEGYYSVMQRIVEATEAAIHTPAFGSNIMIVSHADNIKLLIIHYLRMPMDRMPAIHVPNASLTTIQFPPETPPRMITMSWIPRLDQSALQIPTMYQLAAAAGTPQTES